MSQKKMDAYKEAKKNVKRIRKKEKTNRILAWVAGIIIAAALIAASVFLIYYTNVIKPEQEKAKAETDVDASGSSDGSAASRAVEEVNNILKNSSSEAGTDNSSESSTDNSSDNSSDTTNDSGDAAQDSGDAAVQTGESAE